MVKVINLKYGILECRKWIAWNFYLETILVSKTVSSNLILKMIGSNINTIKQMFCWELEKTLYYGFCP